MNRRLFVANGVRATFGSAAFAQHTPYDNSAQDSNRASSAETRPPRALPSAEQRAWQDLELGMFVHIAPNTWQDLESDDLSTPLSAINPKQLDTDQWARTAVALGAHYIVFVAKHQGGFCMWQTRTTEYSIRNTPWREGKGDVLADIAASCRKYGLKLGVYVCPRDDHFGAATGGICKTPALQAKYDAMYREQLTEVFSRYGSLVELWFDGSTVTPVGDLIARYQPHAAVFQGAQATIRWVGNEDGFAPYPCWNGIATTDARSGTATALNSDPEGDRWMPCEVDVSIRRPDWFWSTTNENKVLTQDQLFEIYYRSVGRGAQLLLNIPANRTGLLSDPDCRVAASFGAEVKRRFATPVASTHGRGSTILLKLAKPMEIDTLVLQEETSGGERILEFKIEGRVDNEWKQLGQGTAVGQKRIQPITPIQVDALRFVSTRSHGTPMLRSFAAFYTGSKPPATWDAAAKMWSADLVGEWKNNSFSLNLTSKIKAAAQYRLRFVPTTGTISSLSEVVFTLHEVEQPALIKTVKTRPDELMLDITEVGSSAMVSGRVEGADQGQILLQKL